MGIAPEWLATGGGGWPPGKGGADGGWPPDGGLATGGWGRMGLASG